MNRIPVLCQVSESKTDDMPTVTEINFATTEREPTDNHVKSKQTETVFVACDENLTSEQIEDKLKTTHILIHDVQSAIPGLSILKPKPSTPVSAGIQGEKIFWDDSVNDPVLPVRCKDTSALLHKDKFGSGNKGKCIYLKKEDEWITPSEFESYAGRGSSKDWKRSIRYGGRMLNCLIEEGFLQPHATSCTCASCCDDETAAGPIRLFVPYKRKKKDEDSNNSDAKKSRNSTAESTKDISPESIIGKEWQSESSDQDHTFRVMMNSDEESVEDMSVTTPTFDINEQKLWWQLDEMVKMFINYGLELKQLVEQMKTKTLESRTAAVQAVKNHMKEDKKQTLNTVRIEAQMMLSKTLLEARAEKEIAVQQALQQVRNEMHDSKVHKSSLRRCLNCNREASSRFTIGDNFTYCSSFCQRKDWSSQKHESNNQLVSRATLLDGSAIITTDESDKVPS